MQRFLCSLVLLLGLSLTKAQTPYDSMPFSTNKEDFTVWNGENYTPFFIKGINLGISLPGTFPGELPATREDYSLWLSMIQEAGFNTIRIYTLHNPPFYEVLDSFNKANPNRPLYFFQGIWLEEEIPNYHEDLYELTASFMEEMRGNIQAVHGNIDLATRPGKASGIYTSNVSKYMLGYIVGREIHPPEVWTTDTLHSSTTNYQGEYLSIVNATPTEAWMTALLDSTIAFEKSNYSMMHPISFSCWPTLDPLHHPDEVNRYEDSVTIDLSKMDRSKAPAGYFASYHAYPYYPDFMSRDPKYANEYDYLGQNSYLGYLKDLRNHYSGIPLVIAEFGASSSWGIAHYAQSGINHGGSTEVEQGEAYLRMFKNLQEAGITGGIQFAWMDEWFKRTWITDPLDYMADRRILWQNITSAEQNFGLVGFKKKGDETADWETICGTCPVQKVEAGADFAFFHLKFTIDKPLIPSDTLWLALDTYADSLGETILPNGDTLNHRSEFCLMITQDKATLFVTQAYDLFGIWHNTSASVQKYRSTKTNGNPWQIVRWKNNNTDNEVQFIGNLGVNRLNLPLKSTDAVIHRQEELEIRLPWTLLQFIDPSEMKVMHDDRSTTVKEDTLSDGIAIDILLDTFHYSSTGRFSWNNWQTVEDYELYQKQSYIILKRELESIPYAPIAHADKYTLPSNKRNISAMDGVLKNDVYFSSSVPEVYIIESTKNGLTQLNTDGSFSYQPIQQFSGMDSFSYVLRAGKNWSEPIHVALNVEPSLSISSIQAEMKLYPNPSRDFVYFESPVRIDNVELFNSRGKLVLSRELNSSKGKLDINGFASGIYFVRFTSRKQQIVHRVVKN